MSSIPTTQKAWVITRKGAPEDAISLQTIPVPKLQAGDVLIKVEAAALNPVGYKIMKLVPNYFSSRPVVGEHDLAGVVVDANGSTEFKVGDKIFGFVPVPLQMKTKEGALAQYTRIPTDHIVHRPDTITATEAAGITLAGQTAWQGLFKVAKLETGQTVFINGGSTSVGAFAIQMAKARGLRVVASASGKNEKFVMSLGADEFIDYTTGPLADRLAAKGLTTKYDAIFEAVGLAEPSLYTKSAAYLQPKGTFISVGPTIGSYGEMFRTFVAVCKPQFLGGTARSWKLVGVQNDAKDLKQIQTLVSEGTLKPVVDSVHSFEDVQKAYERILSSRATGKVVVKVDPAAL